MFTDIVGYTRKMGEDEDRMLRLLQDHNQLVKTVVPSHQGEIIKQIGDAFLISFNSATQAVGCALEIQGSQEEYNRDKPEAEQVYVRIGIHLGDVIIRDEDVFGDGVNIASRVEPLAESGGICITRAVYEIVKKKMNIRAVKLSPQHLKNVDEPVEVYHLLSDKIGVREVRKGQKMKKPRQGRLFAILSMVVACAALVVVLWRADVFRSSNADDIKNIVRKIEVPENRVAVLPLRNLTGDEKQVYFTEGVAEEIIFRLSLIDELYVYPLSDILAISEENRSTQNIKLVLGVKYLVQGNLQKEEDSLVVFMEVINTETMERLSSDRYSELLEERHRLSSRLAKVVLYPIVGRVSGEAEASLAAFASASSMAGDLYLQARHAQREAVTWDDQKNALRLYESAIAADTSFALARAHLAEAYSDIYGIWRNEPRWVTDAMEQAEAAVSLAPDLPEAFYALGTAQQKALRFDLAETSYRRAIMLRPEYRAPLNAMAGLYGLRGKDQEALSLLKQSLELSRAFGDRRGEAQTLHSLGLTYDRLSDYPAALERYRSSMEISREIGDNKQEAGTLNNIGTIHWRKDDLERALQYFESSLSIFRRIGNHMGEANNLANIGAIYQSRNNSKRAMENWQASLKIATEIGNRTLEANNLNWIGVAHWRGGDYYAALENYAASQAINHETGNRAWEAWSFGNIGRVHMMLGEYDLARENFDKAMLINSELESPSEQTWIIVDIGKLFYLQGQLDAARDTLLTVVDSPEADHVSRFIAFLYIGACEVKSGDHKSGLNLIYAALDSLQLVNAPDAKIVEAHRVYGEALLDIGRKEEALGRLRTGRLLAEADKMNGELKIYDRLLARLQ